MNIMVSVYRKAGEPSIQTLVKTLDNINYSLCNNNGNQQQQWICFIIMPAEPILLDDASNIGV